MKIVIETKTYGIGREATMIKRNEYTSGSFTIKRKPNFITKI